MNPALTLLLLLAENDRAREFSKGFREGQPTLPFAFLLLLAAIACGITALCYIAERFLAGQRRRVVNSDGRLLRDLCRAHGLSAASARFLTRLAHQEQLASPAELFLRPELFAAERLAARSPADIGIAEGLRRKLFAG